MKQSHNQRHLYRALGIAAILFALAGCGRNDAADYPVPNDVHAAYPGQRISPEMAALGTPYPLPPTAMPADTTVIVDAIVAFLGIAIDPTTNVIVGVDRYSPADTAGLKLGDVLVAVEGQPIGERLNLVKEAISRPLFHVPFAVVIERNGVQQMLTVEPGRRVIPASALPLPTLTPLPDQYVYL